MPRSCLSILPTGCVESDWEVSTLLHGLHATCYLPGGGPPGVMGILLLIFPRLDSPLRLNLITWEEGIQDTKAQQVSVGGSSKSNESGKVLTGPCPSSTREQSPMTCQGASGGGEGPQESETPLLSHFTNPWIHPEMDGREPDH